MCKFQNPGPSAMAGVTSRPQASSGAPILRNEDPIPVPAQPGGRGAVAGPVTLADLNSMLTTKC